MNRMADKDAAFDALVYLDEGGGDYVAQSVASDWFTNYPDGMYGPWTLAGGDMLHLKECRLHPGTLAVRLDNLSGEGRLGLSLYDADAEYAGLSAAPGCLAMAEATVSGEDAWFTVDILTDGYYCFGIWKRHTTDLPLDVDYRLRLKENVTGMEDETPPSITRLAAARPNPFNPSTTISFDLARAGRARLAVYDLQGRLVKVLRDGNLQAGSHTVLWTGDDTGGRAVASGVYVVRLTAAGDVFTRRLALVK